MQNFTSKIRGTSRQAQWAHDMRNAMLTHEYHVDEAIARRCEREGHTVDRATLLVIADQLTEAKFWIEECYVNPWNGIAAALISYKTVDAINNEFHKLNTAKGQRWY